MHICSSAVTILVSKQANVDFYNAVMQNISNVL